MELWPLYLLCAFLGYCAGRFTERRLNSRDYSAVPQNEDELPLQSTPLAEPSEVSSLRKQLSKEQEATHVQEVQLRQEVLHLQSQLRDLKQSHLQQDLLAALDEEVLDQAPCEPSADLEADIQRELEQDS